MSKLLDRLQQASEGVVQPLGFSVGNRQRIPALALIALLTDQSASLAGDAVAAGAEFVLVSGGPKGGLPKQLPPSGVGEASWGVLLPSITDKQHETLVQAGCDFVVASVDKTPARLAGDEAMDIVALASPTAEDRWFRALDQMPVRAVLAEIVAEPELTLKALMDYASVSSAVGQALLAPASLDWGKAEAEQLRDLGYCGLTLELTSAADVERFKALRAEVLSLPTRSRRKEERPRAHVPQVSFGGGAGRQTEPEPDEDDDF